METSNLKTLLGNPTGFGNYTAVKIIKNTQMSFSLYAYSLFGGKVATGFIFYNNGSWIWTGWQVFNP